MSVYIKGMEMPTSCDRCLISCSHSLLYVGIKDKRSKECPLIEVPTPHGRGIDADALKVSLVFAEKTAKWAVPALRAVLMVIDEMPTIIPAEEGE